MHYKFIPFYLCLLFITFEARPVDENKKHDEKATIYNYIQKETVRGKYYRYQTSNGIEQEQVFVTKDRENNDIFEIHGQYTYKTEDGEDVIVHYEADKYGFRIITPDSIASRIGTTVLESLIGGGVG